MKYIEKNNRQFLRHCIGRSAFYSVSTVHIKDQKTKTNEHD